MTKLKLAEYDLKTGEFVRFHNLERFGFVYGGSFINFDGCHLYYDIDEKDPLNRFYGHFDGRTYGEGRFVLVESQMIGDNVLMTQDDIFTDRQYPQKTITFNNFQYWEARERNGENEGFKILGNLQEKPKGRG